MPGIQKMNVVIPVRLQGILGLPQKPSGIVLFAHGSGSGRLSPRNNFVAQILQEAGMATLLMDLLEEEKRVRTGGKYSISIS